MARILEKSRYLVLLAVGASLVASAVAFLWGCWKTIQAIVQIVSTAGKDPAATLLAVFSSARLTAVAALGVVGHSVALIYTLFGAPDLAMTQFAIETLTVFLFVLVLYRLPRFASLSSRAARVRNAVIALAAGGQMTVLVATAMPLESRLSSFFAENAVPLARGRNIVNVILADKGVLDAVRRIVAGGGVRAKRRNTNHRCMTIAQAA